MRKALLMIVAVLAADALARGGGWSQGPELAPVERIVLGSCANQDRPQPVWKAMLAIRPDVFLSLGDIVYVNRGGEDARARRAAYEKLRRQEGFEALRQQTRFLATWDDGEFGLNDGGGDFPRKEEFRGDFLDFLGEPADSPRRRTGGVYDAHIFGPPDRRVQIILLDTRSFRSPLRRREVADDTGRYLPDDSPEKTMLGAEQWAWLESQLRQPAEVRLIASSIQVIAEDHGWEKWANLPRERKRLFELIRSTGAAGVIFLSGDRHFGELSAMDAGIGYPLFDLTSSGWNVGKRVPVPHEVNRHRVFVANWTDNFGVVAIEWKEPEPVIALQLRDEAGRLIFERRLRLSELRPSGGGAAGRRMPV
jgi:alkaline phosphatase D